MTDDTIRPVGGDLHRLLDGTFAGVEMTPDAQDLKEEMRANLVARVAEFEAAGQSPTVAARRAIAEVGDVRGLLDSNTVPPARASVGWDAAVLRYRVRPKPGFVVGIVVAALAATIGLLLATLDATTVLPLPIGVTIALL